MKLIRRIRKAIGCLVCILMAAILVCNIYTIAARHFTGTVQPDIFGWSWAVVVSGSMEPDIEVNDLIVVHERDDYAAGDVISFVSGRSLVTHRIVELTPEGYTTMGDANNTPDPVPVSKENVVGRVELVVPKAGVLIEYLQSPLGMTCMVLLGILLIEIPCMREMSKGGRNRYEAKH